MAPRRKRIGAGFIRNTGECEKLYYEDKTQNKKLDRQFTLLTLALRIVE